MKLTNNQEYLLKEAIRNEYYRMSYHLENLSMDDYEQGGYKLESDIRDIEDMMVKLAIRF